MNRFLILIIALGAVVSSAAIDDDNEEFRPRDFETRDRMMSDFSMKDDEPIDETKRSFDDSIDFDKRGDREEVAETMMKMFNANEVHKKRLETIDGVEIASSYKEYIELAIGDLDDRLRKSHNQMEYYDKLIKTRIKLLDQIEHEISRRNINSDELREKHGALRDRLSHNAKMKSALIELANIAGLRLNENKKLNTRSLNEQLNEDIDAENVTLFTSSIATSLLDHPNRYKAVDNNTYNQYIEMAYAEVNTVLAADKQTLIEVIRQKKDNDKRLRMLESLKIKVDQSLKRFKQRASKLEELINRESEALKVLTQLKNFLQNRKSNITLTIENNAEQQQQSNPSEQKAATAASSQQQQQENNEQNDE